MSVEQKLITDKNVVAATNSSTTKNNKKNQNNNSNNNNKKYIKKALKPSKNKKHRSSTNVNNKNYNNNTTNGSNNSNCGNNNVVVANDEIIIEELFDFSDIDLKELDETNPEDIVGNNNNLDTSIELLKDVSNKLDETLEVNKNSAMQLEIMTSGNNNHHNHNDDKNVREEEQQQVEILLSSSIDNIDKQNEVHTKDSNALVTIGKEGNEDKGEIDKNTQITEEHKTENREEPERANDDILPNKSSNTSIQIADSSIVSDNSINSESDNKNMKLQESADIKSMETSSLINPKEHSDSKGNAGNDPKNDDDDDNDNDNDGDNDDNECAAPYNELLVQFLDESNQIAEARLAARRHARAEAREIRMRELERQQKEQESNADRVFDMHSTVTGITPLSSHMRLGLGNSPVTGLLNSTRGNSMSSRRSSEDSLEEEGRSLRDIRHELKDVEERFRKAMIANAQLDNDRASQTYQIQLLKDKLEDMEESYSQLQRECKEKTRDCNALKRSLDKLSEELKLVQGQLNERDTLISDQGLVIVSIENEDGTDAKRALVSVENAQLLGSVQGSLDVRLKKFSEEKQQLYTEVQQLQEQLESYKSQGKGRGKGSSSNGPLCSDDDDYEAQREANKIISDYKYKLQKAEQEIASLQSSLARSETQVIRYKSTAEAAEKAEAELKIERRKLQRENREAMEKLEELETSNNHLLKRLDKLKNAKSALLKDL